MCEVWTDLNDDWGELNANVKTDRVQKKQNLRRIIFDKWMITKTKGKERNQTLWIYVKFSKVKQKSWFFTPKKSDSPSSTYNVKKGIICNYIPNMKALTQVLIEKN